MTDAREIIAQYLCDRAGQGWSGVSTFERAAYRTAAHGMIATLTAAGYRILGPDEVDPVTLEQAAAVAEQEGNTWSGSRDAEQCLQEAAVDEKCDDIAAAIRALGRTA